MTYAAYLRSYEPVAAFHEPERSAWAAASATRPRRRDPLAIEHAEALPRARRGMARGLAGLRSLPPGFDGAVWDPSRAETELGEVGRWLAEFQPSSPVELDYGGVVQLLGDDALSGDQSAAEIAAAIDGVTRGERELAIALYRRAQVGGGRSRNTRWRTECRAGPESSRAVFPNPPRCDYKYR